MALTVASTLIQQLQHTKKILIVEDEVLFARAVAKRVQKEGFSCEHAASIAEGSALAKQFQPDLVLLDMRLPDGNGLDLLAELVAKSIPTIVMTAYGDISDAVNAMKMGAIDYLKKPIDLDELLLIVKKNEKTSALQTSLDYASQRNVHAVDHVELIGDSPAMQSVRQQIGRISQLSAMSNTAPPTVLIIGETGTGKDVVARYLHAECVRNDKPFVQIDCASLPAELIESELFGHEKGAYTNAVASRPGLIESAEDGTLFLDEIGDLEPSLQVKILRALQEKSFEPVGSTKTVHVNVRVIAASNVDLEKAVENGQFREDLYYRLNVIPVQIPSLRERRTDVPLLLNHFLEKFNKNKAKKITGFSPEAMKSLMGYSWPGNIRELENLVERMSILKGFGEVNLTDLPAKYKSAAACFAETGIIDLPEEGLDFNTAVDQFENALILKALEKTGWNKNQAAILLRLNRTTLVEKMKKKGLRTNNEGIELEGNA